MGASGIFVLSFFVFLSLIPVHFCYDTIDYEIFDLVEEVNKNFYEVFGVDQSVSTAELKRVYRRLAIQYHPDKNKEEGATEQFRQITSIYEVLKDEDKRHRYNVVLETGLPDWKQPVFYYRRVRKLGLAEMTVIVLGIMTVGHFFMQWASYYEKKYEMEEVFRSRQRKDKRTRGRHKQQQEAKEAEFEEQLQEHLDAVPRPQVLDLVPFRLMALCWWLAVYVVKSPALLKEWLRQREEQRRMEQQAAEEEEKLQQELKAQQELQKARRRKPVDLAELRSQMMESEDPSRPVYGEAGTDDPADQDNEKVIQAAMLNKAGTEWTNEEMVLLAKAVAKFPGGTAKRWVKISQMVGRTQKEVIAMSKNLQQDYTKTVPASAQGITGSSAPKSVEDDVMTQAQWTQNCHGNDSDDLDPDSAVISAGNAAVVRRRKGQRSKAVDASSSEKQNAKNLELDRTKNMSQEEQLSNSKLNSDIINSKLKQTTQSSVPSAAKLPNQSDSSLAKLSSTRSSNPSSDKVTAESADISRSEGSVWSQDQQRVLEWALANIPKGTTDRWGKISEHIPDKTKEDCMARYRYLAEIVKKRKQQQQAS